MSVIPWRGLLRRNVDLCSRLVLMLVVGHVAACSVATSGSRPIATDALHSIYVVRRELHTGIAIAAADWPEQSWSLLADFPGARYLEFGWGDAAYYQADEKTFAMTAAAVLWPTPSVMEVLGLDDIARQSTPDYEVTELHVSGQQLRALAASIASSFTSHAVVPTGNVREMPQGPSRFYHARGKFHLFRMCNRWTTQRLTAIGCSIRPWPVLSASRALREARRCEAERGRLDVPLQAIYLFDRGALLSIWRSAVAMGNISRRS